MSLLDETFELFFGGEHGLGDPITFMSDGEYAELQAAIEADAAELRVEHDFALDFSARWAEA